jgi:hypothetical protein
MATRLTAAVLLLALLSACASQRVVCLDTGRLPMLPSFSEAAAAGASRFGIHLANVGQVSAVAVVGSTIVISLPATAVAMAARSAEGQRTEHGEERAAEARDGDAHRQVGDASRVIREGRKFVDTETGNTVHVSGDRVVITNPEGQIVTQFKNPKANTQARIQNGRWVPFNE